MEKKLQIKDIAEMPILKAGAKILMEVAQNSGCDFVADDDTYNWIVKNWPYFYLDQEDIVIPSRLKRILDFFGIHDFLSTNIAFVPNEKVINSIRDEIIKNKRLICFGKYVTLLREEK